MFALFALASSALAYNATTTVEEKVYTTIECSTPTTVTYGTGVYTVTEATTLTVEDCSCTKTGEAPTGAAPSVAPVATNATTPELSNGAAAAKVGAAAGVAAAVAFIL